MEWKSIGEKGRELDKEESRKGRKKGKGEANRRRHKYRLFY